jgi:hypothetical protein
MSPRRKSGKRILRAFLPIILLVALVVTVVVGLVVYGVTHPPQRAYVVTPTQFSNISARGLKVTDETWSNRDGSEGRGWLLRGAQGAPAVVLLHRYGTNRSWLLNLGIKLNETTNFTVLWPDSRGHGENPPVAGTWLGDKEGQDVGAALDHLRGLKTPQNRPLAGTFGLYGVEMGAYAALTAAAADPTVRTLVLDSVPAAPSDLLRSAVSNRIGFDNRVLQVLAGLGMRVYFLGNFKNIQACNVASSVRGRRVLLLTGEDAGYLRDSAIKLAPCFPDPASVEIRSDLPQTGMSLPFVTSEQDEAYDRRVIDFLDKSLRINP